MAQFYLNAVRQLDVVSGVMWFYVFFDDETRQRKPCEHLPIGNIIRYWLKVIDARHLGVIGFLIGQFEIKHIAAYGFQRFFETNDSNSPFGNN